MFFDLFKSYLDRIMDEYAVILRLNCEGVEDDVIYAAHQFFHEKLVLIMGSIEDVKECKGNSAYVNLEKYLKDNSLSFVKFSSSVNTWIKAHSSINVIHKIFLIFIIFKILMVLLSGYFNKKINLLYPNHFITKIDKTILIEEFNE